MLQNRFIFFQASGTNDDDDDDVLDPSAPFLPPSDDVVDLNTTFVDALQSRQKEEEEVIWNTF